MGFYHYKYVYINMYICICKYIYIYMYANIYIYTYIYIYGVLPLSIFSPRNQWPRALFSRDSWSLQWALILRRWMSHHPGNLVALAKGFAEHSGLLGSWGSCFLEYLDEPWYSWIGISWWKISWYAILDFFLEYICYIYSLFGISLMWWT